MADSCGARRNRRTRFGGVRAAAVAGTVAIGSVLAVAQLPAPVHLVANALTMGGTGTPTPSQDEINSLLAFYVDPATGGSHRGIAVTTPETLPLNTSMSSGLSLLEAAMTTERNRSPGDPYVIVGISQSAIIAMTEKRKLKEQAAAGQDIPDVTFVVIGSGNRPNGGLFARYPGLYIPAIGLDMNGAENTDDTSMSIPTIDITREYDFFGDAPLYPLNPIADLNWLMALTYVHSTYDDGTTSLDSASPAYVPGTVVQQEGDTTFYWIPTANLPLFGPLRDMGVPEAVIDIVEPMTRVIVDAAYDRSVPFGQPTPAQVIPTIDPLTFSLQLAGAAVQGAQNATALAGMPLTGAAEISGVIDAAAAQSGAVIGTPYHDAIATVNHTINDVNPAVKIERPIGQVIDKVLAVTGIQENIINPVISRTPADALNAKASAKPSPTQSLSAGGRFRKAAAPQGGHNGEQKPSVATGDKAAHIDVGRRIDGMADRLSRKAKVRAGRDASDR
ncbi:PE-PPE domain-containing protein [Mycolicibacterium boenickei]